MSIIWGRINFHSLLRPIPLKSFQNTFSHVKAENSGNFQNEKCQLVCLLKHNTPESLSERLPYTIATPKLTITADCRIDNRKELIRVLGVRNISIPDGELILKAYQKWGKRCVEHIIGAFAFAIWDEENKRLFCARDQIGVRPFFYTYSNSFFSFSSEKKGLLVIPDFDDSVNHDYVINQLAFGTQKITSTFYNNIHRLLPAHTLTIEENNKIYLKKYWDLDIHKKIKFKKDSDYIEAFREKMFEAVRCRLRCNKNIGTELSGGLDSSGITAIAQQLLMKSNKSIYAFALLMPDEHRGKMPPYDDNKKYIREICMKSKIKDYHVIETMTYRTFVEWLDLRLKIFDGPDDYNGFGGVSAIKELAKEHNIGAIFSGFPGDELVTSYCGSAQYEYLEKHNWTKFFRTGRSPIKVGQKPLSYKQLILQLGRFYSYHLNKPISNFIYEVTKGKTKLPKHIIEAGFFLKKEYSSKYLNRQEDNDKPSIRSVCFREIQKNTVLRPHTGLRIESENIKNNFFGMENRYPMADIRLLQFMLSVPVEQKRNHEYGRLLYRRGLNSILPDSVVWRKGEGMAGTQPFETIDAQIMHPQLIAFLEKALNDKRLSFLDIPKMITQSNDFLEISLGKKEPYYTAMHRMRKVFTLIRHIQLTDKFYGLNL